ncbi:hypothetical protein GLAREA_11968 [Glarea lozoyensis ATCC 20868]|uniref:Uncharacterized protein n=1 Tax=Glarea lozoyensis (strain ATCC 20868 / MF5171) TaxID=1116229 RepID=S3DIN3_GLAL2|nr:uncharacterized protein GLAREA_11968 [Glarea lozoyensis ATCC 20868]EPE31886.1 hypothetical protein GLAREA_11968 [Glarea lozoyensis ATCC 20868]
MKTSNVFVKDKIKDKTIKQSARDLQMASPNSPQHEPQARHTNDRPASRTPPLKNTTTESITSIGFKIFTLKIPEENSYPLPPLLTLPPEIFRQIYTYVLVPPTSRWETRHKTFCEHRDRTGVSENPPFTLKIWCQDPACKRHVYREEQRRHDMCGCARGEGAGLLRVCRVVYEGARRVFWGARRWGFDDGYQFVKFCDKIQPESRKLIQNVEIVGSGAWDGSAFDNTGPRFTGTLIWDSLMKLECLKTLIIRQDHIENHCSRIVALWALHPDLTIKMAISLRVMPYDCTIPKLKDVWIIVLADLKKTKEWGPLRDQARRFMYDSIVEKCRKEVETQLTEVLEQRPKAVDERLNPVTLPGGLVPGVEEVMVLGLPSCTKERLRMWKEEIRDDEVRKERGELTRKEEEVRVTVERRERGRRVRAEREAEDEQKQRRAAKESNRRTAESREKEEEEERKADRERKERRNIRRLEEVKKKERKRVPDG